MFNTREEYLTQAVQELRPVFTAVGKPLPAKIRVACGFPLDAKRSKAIGQCWADKNSADGSVEILISPQLADPFLVMCVLVHELCHATAGAMNHGVAFQAAAHLMHLEPIGGGREAWKSTRGSATFKPTFGDIIQSLGDYPHAALTFSTRKTQGTRMLKAECNCGYTIRLTNKWAAQGLPTCVCGGTFQLT